MLLQELKAIRLSFVNTVCYKTSHQSIIHYHSYYFISWGFTWWGTFQQTAAVSVAMSPRSSLPSDTELNCLGEPRMISQNHQWKPCGLSIYHTVCVYCTSHTVHQLCNTYFCYSGSIWNEVSCQGLLVLFYNLAIITTPREPGITLCHWRLDFWWSWLTQQSIFAIP